MSEEEPILDKMLEKKEEEPLEQGVLSEFVEDKQLENIVDTVPEEIKNAVKGLVLPKITTLTNLDSGIIKQLMMDINTLKEEILFALPDEYEDYELYAKLDAFEIITILKLYASKNGFTLDRITRSTIRHEQIVSSPQPKSRLSFFKR